MMDSVKIKQRLFLLLFGVILSTCVIAVGLRPAAEDRFRVSNLSLPLELSSHFRIDPPNELKRTELETILLQDFHYMGAEEVSYSFLSSDNKYVLKLFNIKKLSPKRWLKLIPFPGLDAYRFQMVDKRILLQEEIFSSYKLAYEKLQQETGVIFAHLNRTSDLHLRVHLYDRMHNCYSLNLDQYAFCVQKKATLVRDRIAALMLEGKRSEALDVVKALLDHVVSQCKKGYVDQDCKRGCYFGFAEDKVIHFDPGKILYDPAAKKPAYFQREILKVGKKLEDWLCDRFPDLIEEVDQMVNSMIDLPLEPEASDRKGTAQESF